MNIDSLMERRKLRRKVQGIAAALLPFESDGRVVVGAFHRHLPPTHRAGLMTAVHVPTGMGNMRVQWQRCVGLGVGRVVGGEGGGGMGADGGSVGGEGGRGLMEVPELVGMKHSSLDRIAEVGGLALRDAQRPEFKTYTGNDLGINMIEYGS